MGVNVKVTARNPFVLSDLEEFIESARANGATANSPVGVSYIHTGAMRGYYIDGEAAPKFDIELFMEAEK